MPCLTSVPAQVTILVMASAVLLAAGYMCGRRAAAGVRILPGSGLHGDVAGSPTSNSTQPEFNPTNLTDAVLERLRAARASVAARPLPSLAAGGLEAQQLSAKELHASTVTALAVLEGSFAPREHAKLLRALGLLAAANEGIHAAWHALLPVAADRLSLQTKVSGELPLNRTKSPSTWMLSVTVSQKPFGMHIRRGTAVVTEVFPGFPAQQVGVRKGCELKEVAGQKVSSGTWLERFQKSAVPFLMKLSCSRSGTSAAAATLDQGLLSEDEHRYRVMVTKKPYGMNVQVNTLPRVVEVLPGYPAEAAGVRRGFVLTAVNDVPVDAENWFEEYQSASLPFTLTFDTKVPVQPENPYFKEKENDGASDSVQAQVPGAGFLDFLCNVETMPFGMQVKAVPGEMPQVVGVLPDTPAFSAGVHVGDILIEVAGRPVTSENWFAAMQQAITPFGLHFRRPTNNTTLSSGRLLRVSQVLTRGV